MLDPEYLIDTNVLIYAYDAADPGKRDTAIGVLERLATTGRGALSVQVLGEFYTNVIRKPRIPLTRAQARDSVIRLSTSWHTLEVEVRTMLAAAEASALHGLPYWDALVWATARVNGIQTVLTEDGQDGRVIDTVQLVNPFAPSFDLARL